MLPFWADVLHRRGHPRHPRSPILNLWLTWPDHTAYTIPTTLLIAPRTGRRNCSLRRKSASVLASRVPLLHNPVMSGGKFDQAYSFRASETLSQQDRDRRPRRPAPDQVPQGGDGEGMRPCSRGRWCASSYVVSEAGEPRHEPALGPRAFCAKDRDHIERSLEELPEQYLRLHLELGKPSMRGASIRVPFGPRVPIRVDVEALMSLMAESLVSWHERVADVARLDFPSNRMSRMRREAKAVGRAALVLSAHLDAMLALPPSPMSRAWDLRALDSLPEGATGVVRSVFADVTVDLSGADAGLEVLHVRYLARALLGETRQKPEELVGVPCRDPDGYMRVADGVPGGTAVTGGRPRVLDGVRAVRRRMTESDYREWVALCAAYERHRVPHLGKPPRRGVSASSCATPAIHVFSALGVLCPGSGEEPGRGFRHVRGGSALRITRWDGLITVEQAAELCGVKPVTVRNWANRGYGPKDARAQTSRGQAGERADPAQSRRGRQG